MVMPAAPTVPESDSAGTSNAALVRSMLADVSDIVHAEVELAFIRARDQGRRLLGMGAAVAIAGLLAIAGLGFALHAYALALDRVLPSAQAYGLVALTAMIPALGVGLWIGLRVRRSKPLERLIEAIGESRRWLRRKLI